MTLQEKLKRIEALKHEYQTKRASFRDVEPLFSGYMRDKVAILSTQMECMTERVKFCNQSSFVQFIEQVRQGSVNAYQMMKKRLRKGQKDLSRDFICDIHRYLMQEIDPVSAGVWRRMPARWKDSTMIVSNYQKIVPLIDELVNGYNNNVVPAFYWDEYPIPAYQARAAHPVMQAIQINYDLVAIHPFSDGNKRLARTVSNFVLMKNGYAPMVITNRAGYVSGIESYYNTRKPDNFYAVMFQEVEKSQRTAVEEADTLLKQKLSPHVVARRIKEMTIRLNNQLIQDACQRK